MLLISARRDTVTALAVGEATVAAPLAGDSTFAVTCLTEVITLPEIALNANFRLKPITRSKQIVNTTLGTVR